MNHPLTSIPDCICYQLCGHLVTVGLSDLPAQKFAVCVQVIPILLIYSPKCKSGDASNSDIPKGTQEVFEVKKYVSEMHTTHIGIFQLASAVNLTSQSYLRKSQLGDCLHQIGRGVPSLLWAIPPGQVVLGCITKLAGQEPGEQANEQHFSVVFKILCEFLPWLPTAVD